LNTLSLRLAEVAVDAEEVAAVQVGLEQEPVFP